MSYIKRAPISQERKEMIHDNARKFQVADENGNFLSPNGTRRTFTAEEAEMGHVREFENRYERIFSEKAGLTQKQHNELFTNPGMFQLEPGDENRSHQFECKDKNEAMQNISAYACSEDPDIAARTYINPSADHNSGTISIVNAQTGEEETLSSYSINASENAVENTASVAEESTYTAAEAASNETVDADIDADAEVDAYEDAYTL